MYTSNNPQNNSLLAMFYKRGNSGPRKLREYLKIVTTIYGLSDIIPDGGYMYLQHLDHS